MSDNDLISRSHFDDRVRLAAGPDADEEFSADFLDGVKTVLYMLSTEPAVPQEMSAVEYARALYEMSDADLDGAFTDWSVAYHSEDFEGAVAIVEKWAREHLERSEE